MTKPITLENRIRQHLDKTCEKIIKIMLIHKVYEEDKKRYNELYRIVKGIIKISKPTFNDHIKHLIKKKLVRRVRTGKQRSYLFLNGKNQMISNAEEMIDKIKNEERFLAHAVKSKDFGGELPAVLSVVYSISGLRHLQMVLRFMLNPEKSYQNVLALSVVADVEDLVLFSLASSIMSVKSQKERRKKLEFMLDAINQAMEQMAHDMAAFIQEKT